jgi:hypothetical protein
MGIDDRDHVCACDNCRIERARRRWYETWCRGTNRRLPRWAGRESLIAPGTEPGEPGRRTSDH